MSKRTAPTMKDVALEAGVSLGTVSRVLNGRKVGSPYQERVREAADRLGYRMNRCARGLKSGSTSTVALILPNLFDVYFNTLAQSICEALRERGCGMLLFLSRQESERERECLRQAQEHQVDGIIAVCFGSEAGEFHRVPVVTIDRVLSQDIPCVSADNFGGGMLAARKLSELGCSHLLGVQLSGSVHSEADKRIDGFQALCGQIGVDHSVVRTPSEAPEQTQSIVSGHMNQGRFDFDGVFCSTNLLAYQMGASLRACQIDVPEQVQIIGFGGIEAVDHHILSCSTIFQPVRQIAETAVELLLNRERENQPTLVCLPVGYSPGTTTRDEMMQS